jgi:hypothetical protein
MQSNEGRAKPWHEANDFKFADACLGVVSAASGQKTI